MEMQGLSVRTQSPCSSPEGPDEPLPASAGLYRFSLYPQLLDGSLGLHGRYGQSSVEQT